MKKPRLIFFGTPEFATASLRALYESDAYEIVAVITQPDKPAQRKQKLTPPPVKVLAESLSIPVFQPKSCKPTHPDGQKLIDEIKFYAPDIAVVVAYGKILPKEILTIPPFGCVNVHGSLLPLLRGPSPIHTAILEGHTSSGISIMLLEETMDTGPVLSKTTVLLRKDETTQTLHDTLMKKGASLLVETLPKYMDGTITPKEQNHEKATYCHLIEKTDGEIDWNEPDEIIERKIRAYTPWPSAYTYENGKRIKIIKAHLDDGKCVLDTVQPEGKKPMSYADFQRGNPQTKIGKKEKTE